MRTISHGITLKIAFDVKSEKEEYPERAFEWKWLNYKGGNIIIDKPRSKSRGIVSGRGLISDQYVSVNFIEEFLMV